MFFKYTMAIKAVKSAKAIVFGCMLQLGKWKVPPKWFLQTLTRFAQGRLVYRDGVYWLRGMENQCDPYCARCNDAEEKRVHLQRWTYVWHCPECGRNVSRKGVPPMRPPMRRVDHADDSPMW